MSEDTQRVENSTESETQNTNSETQKSVIDENSADIKKQIADLHKESASYRKRVRELEALVQVMEGEKSSTLSELTALKEYKRDTTIRTAFNEIASELGVSDTRAAYKLADLSRVEFDEQGTPKSDSLKTIISALKEEFPLVFKSSPASTGRAIDAGNGSAAPSGDLNMWIRNLISNK